MLERKEIELQLAHFNFAPLVYIGIILPVFKIEGNTPDEKVG